MLVDTGPLVSFLCENETTQEWVAARFAELPAPFFTCEAVLAETFFLLSRQPRGAERFFELLSTGLLSIEFSVLAEQESLAKLIRKYRDLPMSLADACLVRLAELHPGSTIFTLDTHFRIYRKNGRQQIPVIMP